MTPVSLSEHILQFSEQIMSPPDLIHVHVTTERDINNIINLITQTHGSRYATCMHVELIDMPVL